MFDLLRERAQRQGGEIVIEQLPAKIDTPLTDRRRGRRAALGTPSQLSAVQSSTNVPAAPDEEVRDVVQRSRVPHQQLAQVVRLETQVNTLRAHVAAVEARLVAVQVCLVYTLDEWRLTRWLVADNECTNSDYRRARCSTQQGE
jgi:hypothetical protein